MVRSHPMKRVWATTEDVETLQKASKRMKADAVAGLDAWTVDVF